MPPDYLNRTKNFPASLQLTVWIIVICVLVGSVPALDVTDPVSPELVYCPLQKAWVNRRGDTEPLKPAKILDEICSPIKQKQSFVVEITKHFLAQELVATQDGAEKLYFSYLDRGRRAFVEINPLNDGSGQRLERPSVKQKSAGVNFAPEFSQESAELLSLETLARPPTNYRSRKFDSQIVPALDTISRNINPRSPPLSF